MYDFENYRDALENPTLDDLSAFFSAEINQLKHMCAVSLRKNGFGQELQHEDELCSELFIRLLRSSQKELGPNLEAFIYMTLKRIIIDIERGERASKRGLDITDSIQEDVVVNIAGAENMIDPNFFNQITEALTGGPVSEIPIRLEACKLIFLQRRIKTLNKFDEFNQQAQLPEDVSQMIKAFLETYITVDWELRDLNVEYIAGVLTDKFLENQDPDSRFSLLDLSFFTVCEVQVLKEHGRTPGESASGIFKNLNFLQACKMLRAQDPLKGFIIYLRQEGWTLKRIEEEFGITESMARNLVARSERTLAAILKIEAKPSKARRAGKDLASG